VSNISIYFPAGDFVDVLRRYDKGLPQRYQTHDEVARLIYDLHAAGRRVTIYSFVTPERGEVQLFDGARVINLGAKDFSARSLLGTAVAADGAEAIVAHFPDPELLGAAIGTKSRVIAVLANSYNRTGIRAALMKRRVVSQLNDPRVEFVSNHCFPATKQLARMGVTKDKLIAWDVPHVFDPASQPSKALSIDRRPELFYAGSISEDKGIGDLIRAIALLQEEGFEAHCSLAGRGDIEAMQALASQLGVKEQISFLGLIDNPLVFKTMIAADLVVVPSRHRFPEGFPLSMFEAIASRTPIVCSDHPMFRDIMRDKHNASVFAAGSHRALASALHASLTNATLYAELSRSAGATWKALQGPADWRTLIFKWAVEGHRSPWIRNRTLFAVEATPDVRGPSRPD
jgi:glycosyltransferase involved in cell wall biosynthesis